MNWRFVLSTNTCLEDTILGTDWMWGLKEKVERG